MKNIYKKEIKKINNFIYSTSDKKKSYAWQVGYENFGILLLGFCNWVHKEKEIKKLDSLFFLARDGYIIRKAYKLLYPNEDTHYLYLSRRSLSLPSIMNAKNSSDIMNSLILPPIFTIETFLSALGLARNDVTNELRILQISKDEKFTRSTFKTNHKLITLINMIFQKIIVQAKKQNKIFLSYLKQENFHNNVGIIDIGWHNSIQYSIINIIKNVDIYGYYIGIYKNSHIFQGKSTAQGYLYSYGNNINRQIQTFSFVSLFETFFLAHEGTTLGYKTSGKKVIPILKDYEYNDESSSLKIITDLQQGALEFIKNYIKSNLDTLLIPDICSYNILKFGCHPTQKSMKIFGSISFENYTKNNIINFNYSSLYYFLHFKKLKEDFYKSGWRIAFLKKLFKLPLPYFYIMKLLCVLFEKEQNV